ncbi:MAG: tetratricopeptide repeat protein [Myxococcota bacterium]
MFVVDASYESIPPINEVPETKEEKRQRLVFRVTAAAIALFLTAITVIVVLYLLRLAEIDESIALAENDGRPASVAAALELSGEADDADSRALHARLNAILVLEGATEAEPTLQIITEDASESDGSAERLIAGVFLSLAAGDVDAAAQNASQLAAQGPLAAEAAHARALAALAVINLEQAVSQARIAVDERPESPRHRALLSEMLNEAGEGAEARAALEGAPDHPAVLLARARSYLAEGTQPEAGIAVAESVQESDRATPREAAWAKLTLAQLFALSGLRSRARAMASEAAETPPPGDHRFHLELAELYVRVGAWSAAKDVSLETVRDTARRSLVRARLALQAEGPAAATQVLAQVPSGPRLSLVRGQVFSARDQLESARPEFERGGALPRLRVETQVKRAEAELEAGNHASALELLGPLVEAQPTHPELVSLAADAHRGQEQLSDGAALLRVALEAHAADALLLAARGRIELAQDQNAEAFASFQAAAEDNPDDPDLQADRGTAAVRTEHFDVARQAFDKALELDSTHPVALLGRWRIDVAEERAEGADEIRERVEGTDLASKEIELLRAKTFVLNARGLAGIRPIRQGIVRQGTDPGLFMAMGQLYIQGEQYDAATGAFGRALELTEEGIDTTEIRLLRALAYVRARRTPPAESTLEDLSRRELPPELEVLRKVIAARVAWVARARARARQLTREALAIDADFAEAHLLMADYAQSRDEDPIPHLQAALRDVPPPPEAMGRLALRGGAIPDDERCQYARAYLAASPRGETAAEVRERVHRCRD